MFRELAESHRRELQVHCYRIPPHATVYGYFAAWSAEGIFTEFELQPHRPRS